jgi:hypothetical protein
MNSRRFVRAKRIRLSSRDDAIVSQVDRALTLKTEPAHVPLAHVAQRHRRAGAVGALRPGASNSVVLNAVHLTRRGTDD